MFAHRVLLMRPGLNLPAQVRTFSLARIALEPTRKTAPPPPPPPAKKKLVAATATAAANTKKPTKAVAASPTTKKKAAPAPPAPTPAPRKQLTDKERIAAQRAKERERVAAAKAREKERNAKTREKEKEKERAKKERLKEREAAKREKERIKAEKAKAREKPYPAPPKRPSSGYFLFARDPKVNRDRGEGVTEDAIKAAEAWKALTEAEREAYNKKAEKARVQFKEDVARWVSSLNFAQLQAARANREPGTRDESAMETLPKRPANAYAMFLADVTSRQDFRDKVESLAQKQSGGDDNKLKKTRIGLFGRASADLWNTMSEKEKAVYAAKAADAKKNWDNKYGSLLATQKEALDSAYA